MDERPRLVVIVGPTAVGKTQVALELAARLDGEIISADSRTFYRGLDIGTAKPSTEERQRVPHHLVDIADPDQTLGLADFQEAVHLAVAAIHQRGHLPFLVGGSGQYIRAVLQGWQAPAVAPDPHLRRVLENWAVEIGSAGLHARLAVLDPQAAAQIDHRNLRRTVRALEVIFSSGQQFSALRTAGPSAYRALVLGLRRPRDELYARIDARIEAMLQAGLVEEVRGLLAQGYAPDLPALSAIGYREVVAYLQGEITLGEAQVLIKRNTRIFVRRQNNWFKPEDPDIHWFDCETEIQEPMVQTIQQFLNLSEN